MKITLKNALLVALAFCSSTTNAADYIIDTEKAHAFIEFKISHLGTSWLKGRFNNFQGNFNYDADHPENASIKVEIDVSSIDSNHAERDKHLRSDKYLYTDKFDTASFTSTGFTPDGPNGGIMQGDLTLYGVTKPITIDVEKVGEGPDPWGGYRVGFSGKTELILKDFGMRFNLGSAAETVYMELNIEGIRQ